MARVLALLTPYFTASVPEGVRRMEAEDWRAALGEWPQWAVEKACRWWKSDANPDHRRKPIEGDIVERVRFEMGILSFAAMKVREFDAGYEKRHATPEPSRPTPAEMERRRQFAQATMERLGYARAAPATGPRRETVTDEDKAEMAEILKRMRG
jgi:hypothetical protein